MAADQNSPERPAFSEWKLALAGIAVCAASLMLVFESTKQLVFPHITIWQSHALTIVFTTVLAVVAGYLVGSRLAHLNCVLQLLIERRNADIVKLQESQAQNAEMEQQLIRSTKMESIGRLAGGVAHDFNNLLTILMGYSSRLEQCIGSDENLLRELNGIKRATDRAAALTRQLLAFSRQQVLQPSLVNLNLIVDETKSMLTRIIPEQIEIAVVTDPELGPVNVDRGQIEQVIVNLALNARDAMSSGGKLILQTANVTLDSLYSSNHLSVQPGNYVMLAVSDTGCGMDAATQDRIFEPFFTTKEVGRGTGLGLASVYGIVKQSGGYIWVYSEPGRGTTFKIYLPRVQAAHHPAAQPAGAVSRPTGTETILLVEDNLELRQLAESTLTAQGYTVLCADSPRLAQQLATQHSGAIDLLLTDVVMPEMSGMELAQSISESRKEMKIFYMSGYADNMVIHRDRLNENAMFLQKPFAPSVLAAKVREALDQTRADGQAV